MKYEKIGIFVGRMTKKTITVTEETFMMDVIKLLEDKHLIRVPVVKNKKSVGILAPQDLLLCHLKATSTTFHKKVIILFCHCEER